MTRVRDLSYEHQQLIEAMKSQLLIVLVNRLGGVVDIPVGEVDDVPRGVNLAMSVRNGVLHFEVQEKQK